MILSGILIAYRGANANVPATRSRVSSSVTMVERVLTVSGEPSSVGEVSIPVPGAFGGTALRSYRDDYYYRVWIVPERLDFGVVAGVSTKAVKVWNAYPIAVVLEGVSTSGDSAGLSLGIDVPETIPPLSMRQYIAQAEPSLGPNSFLAHFVLSFDNDYSFDLIATGLRSGLWSIAPNWKSPVRVNYEFKTEILTSKSGREQRIAVRKSPRKKITLQTTATPARAKSLFQTLDVAHGIPFILGDPTQFCRSVDSLDPGQSSIVVDEAPAWLDADSSIVLVSPESTEVLQVASVVGDTIALDNVVARAWPAGSKFHRAVSVYLNDRLSMDRKTSTVVDFQTDFEVVPLSANDSVGVAGFSFEGREVFPFKPNWSGSPQIVFERDRDVVDFDYGTAFSFRAVEFESRVYRHSFVAKNRTSAEELVRFVLRMGGARGEFLWTTGTPDLVLRSDVIDGSDTLRVVGSDIHTLYSGSPTHRFIRLQTVAGLVYAEVTGTGLLSDELGDDTVLSLAGPLPALAVADVYEISWLLVSRFEGDSYTFEWLTDGVCRVALNIRTLEALDAE